MNFLLSLIQSLFISTACSDDCLAAEYNSFYFELAKRKCYAPQISYNLVDLPANFAGYCVHYVSILVDKEGFKKMGPLQRKEIVYHELGHCVMFLEHTDHSNSLMSPVMHKEEELQKNFSVWLEDFFKDCNKY